MKTFIVAKSVAVLGCAIVMAGRLSADSIVNGGFESGLTGWESSGNIAVKSGAPYSATDGTRLAVFNSVNSTPNGVLSQATTVIPGHRYRLEFDAGNLAFNSLHQRLRVQVLAYFQLTTIIGDVIDIPGPGGGATAWVGASYEFVATTDLTIIAFSDISTDTNALDLVLDRVRLNEVSTAPLTNGSFESGLAGWTAGGNVSVQSGAPYLATQGTRLAAFNAVNSEPNGNLSQIVATLPGHSYRLQFDVGNLSFNSLHQRLLVVVGNAGYKQFPVVDTIDIPGPGSGATAWVAASYVFTATGSAVSLNFSDVSLATFALDLVLDNVRLTEVVATDAIANGGFESGLTGWTASGNVGVQSAAPYLALEGSRLAAFNAGNSTPDGTLAQAVATLPDHLYRLEFGAGNLSFNSAHQRVQVQVTEIVNGGTVLRVNDIVDIAGPGGGATAWVSPFYLFTPLGNSVILTFTDVSQATNALDLVLDRVRMLPIEQ